MASCYPTKNAVAGSPNPLDITEEIPGRIPVGATAFMLGASALALTAGQARADCAPAPTGGDDMITCDAVGADVTPSELASRFSLP